MERHIVADRGDAGSRLDLMLRRHLAGAEAPTRTQVQGWIRQSAVAVNGSIVRRVAARTAIGDIVTIALPETARRHVMHAEAVPLEVLHEDADLIIINKPAGIVVHPTYGHMTATVMNGLLWRAREWPEGQRPSIVGRLDKQTSGLVVVARSRPVHAALQRALSGTSGEKEYLAVVYGRVPPIPFAIDLRLRRDPADRRRVVASVSEGLASLTLVTPLAVAVEPDVTLSLVRCRLATGRMHQIRVHLSARGWPIVGDAKYGRANGAVVFPRQALHASRLAVAHPRTGERLVVEAPLHQDMRDLVERYFGGTGSARAAAHTI